MKVYAAVWGAVCAALAVVGVSVVLLLSPSVLAVLGVSFGFVGAVLACTLTEAYWQSTWWGRVGILGRGALLGAVTVGAFAGHVVLLGAGVFLLVLVVAATSPLVSRRYVRWLRAPREAGPLLDQIAGALAYGAPELAAPVLLPAPASPAAEGSELASLTDEQLCRQWRATYPRVLATTDAAARARVVEHRQRLLDELERRHSVGFTAWLASSPRSAGNPLPYLQGRRASRCRIDWDDLITGQDR